MDWQPGETAPKSDPCWLYFEHVGLNIGYWKDREVNYELGSGGPVDVIPARWILQWPVRRYTTEAPVSWMPLPEPPNT